MAIKLLTVLALLFICLALPLNVAAEEKRATVSPSFEQGVWVSYGFAFLNPNKQAGRIQGGRNYDFWQAGYLYERHTHFKKLALIVEPFAAYVNRPAEGVDVGFNAGLKYYFLDHEHKGGPFVTAGTGMAYTTTGFLEQGTHLLFILQGGIGYRYKQFFIEDRFRHYSNGTTAWPNRSVHANILMVGMYF